MKPLYEYRYIPQVFKLRRLIGPLLFFIVLTTFILFFIPQTLPEFVFRIVIILLISFVYSFSRRTLNIKFSVYADRIDIRFGVGYVSHIMVKNADITGIENASDWSSSQRNKGIS